MKFLFNLLCMAVLIFIAGCTQNDVPVSPQNISGTYNYTGYNANNNVVATGTLQINLDGQTISGFKDLAGDSNYEAGKGEISGTIDAAGGFTLYLTDMSPIVVYLVGNLRQNLLTGDRYLDTRTTPYTRKDGTFVAVRK